MPWGILKPRTHWHQWKETSLPYLHYIIILHHEQQQLKFLHRSYLFSIDPSSITNKFRTDVTSVTTIQSSTTIGSLFYAFYISIQRSRFRGIPPFPMKLIQSMLPYTIGASFSMFPLFVACVIPLSSSSSSLSYIHCFKYSPNPILSQHNQFHPDNIISTWNTNKPSLRPPSLKNLQTLNFQNNIF